MQTLLRLIFQNLTRILFLTIVLFALYLRIDRISSVPPNPSLDEVSLGYNAYSILKTGKDEYGTFMPLTLRAYDDWRPALYVYIVAPFVAFFGLTTASVRLPSALLSIITIILTYHISSEILASVKQKKLEKNHEPISLLSMFFVAIMPWHIYLSRMGHEANLGLTMTTLVIYLILRYNRTQSASTLYFALFASGVGMLSYQSEKIVIPMILLVYGIWRLKNIVTYPKRLLISAVIVVVFVVMLVSQGNQSIIRYQATSVLATHPDMIHAYEHWVSIRDDAPLISKILHYPKFIAIRILIQNYLTHFSLRWLFTGGANEAHKMPFTGILFVSQGILFIAALLFLGLLHVTRPYIIFLLLVILISVVPAGITTQTPHVMRTMTAIPAVSILSAFGCISVYRFLQKYAFMFRGFLVMVVLFSLYEVFGAYGRYVYYMPFVQAKSYQIPFFTALEVLEPTFSSYNKIVISNEDLCYQSYMYYLFVSKYNPKTYIHDGGTKSGGYAVFHTIGNIEFRPVVWDRDSTFKNTLIIGNLKDIPETKVSKRWMLPDSTNGVVITETL